jgi:hypothetical protein
MNDIISNPQEFSFLAKMEEANPFFTVQDINSFQDGNPFKDILNLDDPGKDFFKKSRMSINFKRESLSPNMGFPVYDEDLLSKQSEWRFLSTSNKFLNSVTGEVLYRDFDIDHDIIDKDIKKNGSTGYCWVGACHYFTNVHAHVDRSVVMGLDSFERHCFCNKCLSRQLLGNKKPLWPIIPILSVLALGIYASYIYIPSLVFKYGWRLTNSILNMFGKSRKKI